LQFLFVEFAGKTLIELKNQEYKYLAKVRRAKVKDKIFLRNLKDKILFTYEITSITRNSIFLKLLEEKELLVEPKNFLHLGWAIIDPKNIQKTLPALNEIGISKITFFYASRSQKNYKIDLEKLKKILIHSCEQSGRSSLMELEILKDLEEFLKLYPESIALDFGGKSLGEFQKIKSVIIGPEGGFTEKERELFGEKVVKFNTPFILQSHTASVAIASALLLA